MSVHNFDLTTDYATLKNDSSGVLTLPITTGYNINPGASRLFETFVTAGSLNSQVTALMSSSATGIKYAANVLTIKMRATYGTVTVDSWQFVIIEKSDASTVRLYCNIHNSQSSVMNVSGGAQTVTAEFETFKSPFLP